MRERDDRSRAYLATFFGTAFAVFGSLYAAIVFIDPYSTGRFTLIQRTDIATDDPTLANAARARDRRFNAAVIGNSRMMRLSPAELDRMTGLKFVSLAMPGVGPAEQFATARAFVRNHSRPLTIVWGIDHGWCESTPPRRPFPFWLYDDATLSYLRNIFSPTSIQVAQRRLKMLLKWSPPKGPENGYEPDHPYWLKLTQPDANMEKPISGEPVDAPMPAVSDLKAFLSDLDAQVRLLFVVPPTFANMIPKPGSPAALRRTACDEGIRQIVSQKPSADLLNLLQDTPATRNPANFVDAGHYRDNIARTVERSISVALRGTEPPEPLARLP